MTIDNFLLNSPRWNILCLNVYIACSNEAVWLLKCHVTLWIISLMWHYRSYHLLGMWGIVQMNTYEFRHFLPDMAIWLEIWKFLNIYNTYKLGSIRLIKNRKPSKCQASKSSRILRTFTSACGYYGVRSSGWLAMFNSWWLSWETKKNYCILH